jgi:DNA-binding NarL/FixJ family response regulator
MSEPAHMKVLLVDDHEVVHWGFRILFNKESWVSGLLIASSGARAVELAQRHLPRLAIVDLTLGSESGADVCPRLLEVSSRTRILLISGNGRLSQSSVRALGASGFVPKSWSGSDLLHAARLVGMGMTVFPPAQEQPQQVLSRREREIVSLMAGGATNAEIAELLFLSAHTVKDHSTSIYRKLGVRNRAQAVMRAEISGLLLDNPPGAQRRGVSIPSPA